MWAAILSVGQHASGAWGILTLLASTLLILAFRGPAYIAAYTAYKVAMREQNRLDRNMPREAELHEFPLPLDMPPPKRKLERAA